jgi:hypothetical protein
MSDYSTNTPSQPEGERTTGFWYRLKSPWRQLLAFGLLVLAIVGFAWAATSLTTGEADAQQQCEDRVELRLKSPSTADFGDSSTRELGSTGTRWEVSGVVDAENSFGATVRLTYKCDLTYDEESDSWDAALVDVRE